VNSGYCIHCYSLRRKSTGHLTPVDILLLEESVLQYLSALSFLLLP
jgi:hypothetical protein